LQAATPDWRPASTVGVVSRGSDAGEGGTDEPIVAPTGWEGDSPLAGPDGGSATEGPASDPTAITDYGYRSPPGERPSGRFPVADGPPPRTDDDPFGYTPPPPGYTPPPPGYTPPPPGYTPPPPGYTPPPPPGYTPPPAGPPDPPRHSAWESFRTAYDQAPITVGLVVLTVAVWLAHEAIAHFAGVNTDLTLGDPGTAIHGDWWRLVTPMVVHFGLLHLGLNMFVLWRLGPPVEQVVGRRTYLAAYIASGIGGQIASDLTVHPVVRDGFRIPVLSGGASGAIYGVIGILIGYYFATRLAERWGREVVSGWRFNPKAVKSLAIQAGVWLIIAGPLIHADSAAHAGGGLVGLLIGAAVAWSRTAPAGRAPAAPTST